MGFDRGRHLTTVFPGIWTSPLRQPRGPDFRDAKLSGDGCGAYLVLRSGGARGAAVYGNRIRAGDGAGVDGAGHGDPDQRCGGFLGAGRVKNSFDAWMPRTRSKYGDSGLCACRMTSCCGGGGRGADRSFLWKLTAVAHGLGEADGAGGAEVVSVEQHGDAGGGVD